jgi:hypothetical protein
MRRLGKRALALIERNIERIALTSITKVVPVFTLRPE